MAYERLVNPVDYFRNKHPEAFECLPGGASDLDPEITLMQARAKAQGRQVFEGYGSRCQCAVPEEICEEVFSRSRSIQEIEEEISSLT